MATRPTTSKARAPARKTAAKAAPAEKPLLTTAGRKELVKMLYDAGGNGRRMRSWNPPAAGPNLAMNPVAERMRARTRDSVRNDWGSKAASQKWGTTLIGIGITPRFKGVTNKTRREKITEMFKLWAKTADADWVLDVYGMQTLAVRAFFDGGEVFIRARPRDNADIYTVNIQFQLLESEMLPYLDADTYTGLPADNIIRSGVEFNRYGRRVAYWFYRERPNDNSTTFAADPSALVRVAASQVSHFFIPDRPGQIRGVSQLATVLARLRNVSDYEDAVLERQKLANLFVAFIKKTLPDYSELDNNHLGDPLQYDAVDPTTPFADQKAIMPMEPGATVELAEGEDMQFSNPPEAGTTYSEYMRTTHMGTASGLGIPYELFSGDIYNISDRTLRVVINEFHRLAEQYQWQGVIPMVCQFMIDKWVDAAVLDGTIGVNEAIGARNVEHAPHGWAYIHPVQDVQGKALEVSNGFRSRSSVIAERGDDASVVDDERAEDQKREKELDIFVDPNAATNAANTAVDDPATNTPEGSNGKGTK